MNNASPTDREIQGLIDLISNSTDAYTTALFLAPSAEADLTLYAYQSLSRSINQQVVIGPGEGLIGWVHKNNKPINVDQFDRDTRNLLLYRSDEAIKSFMAVPLPKVHGVLAVDSKQRYVFTEKSHKILFNFGQVLEMALERVGQSQLHRRFSAAMSFMAEFEQLVGQRPRSEDFLKPALGLIRHYSGAVACFIVALVHRDPNRYFLMAYDSHLDLRLHQDILPLESGLAGWILQNKKSLVLERPRNDTERSFLFYPDEPLKKLPGFAGFPIFYATRLRGALLLSGETGLNLHEVTTQCLELAADRLGATLEMEVLFQRVNEISQLDPQIRLPHRTYFCRRLERLLKEASASRSGVHLILIELLDLDRLAIDLGQEEAQNALRAVSRIFLSRVHQENELGHISYGIIGVAIGGRSKNEAERIRQELTSSLSDGPVEILNGRVSLRTRSVLVHFPEEARGAEEMIHFGLSKFA